MDTDPTASTEQTYEALYPYYAEVCALSELRKKPGFGADISSGVGGHAVLYLNGACRDDSAHYPTIKLCGAGTLPAQRGVGLSVNAHYKNANWVATPGRDFFFHGTLKPGQRLTRAAYEQTQRRAEELGILDGVAFHSGVFDNIPKGMSRRDFKYEMSVATDYALGFGRDRYCARVPMDRDRMARVVDFLNGLNAVYKDGKTEFDWNILRNNCSHVTHNALASAGIWSRWATEQFILIAALDFPVPKNEFVNLMRRTNDMRIDDIDAVYADRAARRALLRTDSLPTAPGGLAEAEPAVHDNDVYDTDLSLIFYDDPVFGSYRRHFQEIFSDPRYFDLRANLQHFAALYRKLEREREPFRSFLIRHDASTSAKRQELKKFYVRYYAYVAQERAAVEAGLAYLPPVGAQEEGAGTDHEGSARAAWDSAKNSPHHIDPAEGFPKSGAADTMRQVRGR